MSATLRLDDAGKRYVKYDDVPLLLTRLRFRARNRREELWAVRHVDLEVSRGENVGVIGRNGAGKTTMLRMLAGVTAPTEGLVSVRGRVAPLLAVGVGFHQELTGRENVYVNGMILGFPRREIDRLFDSIVSFAELERFIDTPVKFYSSGMLVRLGFAAAVAVRPDILLVDEVLAVGDVAFQSKCFDRMAEMKAEGTSVLVVSHNLNAVQRSCSRVLVLHEGTPRFLGDTSEAIAIYHELIGDTALERAAASSDTVEVLGWELLDDAGRPIANVPAGSDVVFRLDVRFNVAVDDPVFAIEIKAESGDPVYWETTFRKETGSFRAGDVARCDIRVPMWLATGSFVAHGGVGWERKGSTNVFVRGKPVAFFVAGRAGVRGPSDLHGSFEVGVQPAAAPDDAAAHPAV